MKGKQKSKLLSVFLALVLVVAIFGISTANATMSINPMPTRTAGSLGVSWSYDVMHSNGIIKQGGESIITIYDFKGFITGTGFAPTGWDFTSALVGTTPSGLTIPDDSSIVNLTWTYTGIADITTSFGATLDLGNFGAQSSFNELMAARYGSQDMSHASTISNSAGFVIGPEGSVSVPEPTTMLLLGIGLIGLAGVRISRRGASARSQKVINKQNRK